MGRANWGTSVGCQMYPFQRSKVCFIQTRNCDLLKAVNAHIPWLNPVRLFHGVHFLQAKSWFYFQSPDPSPVDFGLEISFLKAHLLQGITGLNSSSRASWETKPKLCFICVLEAVKEDLFFFFFAVEAMRAVLRQVIVKRWGGVVSVLGAFSNFRVFWQGGRQIAL